MATTIVSSFKATSDLSTNRLRVDIGDKITLLDINENPATFVSQRVNVKKAKQPKVSWLEDVYRPDTDQINFSTGYVSTKTAITVDNYSYYNVGDLWMHEISREILYVNSVSSDSIVNFTRNFPSVSSGETGYPGSLADNDYLVLLSNASEEGSSAPTAHMTQETQVDNYCQIVKTTFELTETEMASLHEAEAELPYQARKKGREHAHELERLFWWGIPSQSATGDNGKYIRTTGGVYWYIKENAPSGNVNTSSDITEDEFLTWVRNCFRYGSPRKWLFGCPILMSAFEKWGLGKLNLNPNDHTGGLVFNKWQSKHGELIIVNHKMLEGPVPGTRPGFAFILDMDKVKFRPLRNTRMETNIQDNDEDRYEAQYLTEFSLEVREPSSHGVMNNILTFSA